MEISPARAMLLGSEQSPYSRLASLPAARRSPLHLKQRWIAFRTRGAPRTSSRCFGTELERGAAGAEHTASSVHAFKYLQCGLAEKVWCWGASRHRSPQLSGGAAGIGQHGLGNHSPMCAAGQLHGSPDLLGRLGSLT